MMGKTQQRQAKLFYTTFSLDRRVGPDNKYRRILQAVDFSFVRPMVASLYGSKGNESSDPIVIMKLMLILFIENVSSERELMRRLPERLDWLWFCQYDLDDPIPDHSVLSKARRRWGLAVFERFFQDILAQCHQAGLIGGETIHIDPSLIKGNASADSLKPAFAVLARETFERLETQCDALDTPQAKGYPTVCSLESPSVASAPIEPATHLSSTDPEARCRKKGRQEVIGYQEHRIVDDRYGIITASDTTDASVHESRMLEPLLRQHQANTDSCPTTLVGDKAYGTSENYKHLQEQQIAPCIPHIKHVTTNKAGYPREQFVYDPALDHYTCPAGQILKRVSNRPNVLGNILYRAKASACRECAHRQACLGGTKCPNGKSVCRSQNQGYLDWADQYLSPSRRRYLLRRRGSVVEGSFADASNQHGFKRSRWRGWLRVKIQNLMISMLQNLCKLLKYGSPERRAGLTAFKPLCLIAKTLLILIFIKLRQINPETEVFFVDWSPIKEAEILLS